MSSEIRALYSVRGLNPGQAKGLEGAVGLTYYTPNVNIMHVHSFETNRMVPCFRATLSFTWCAFNFLYLVCVYFPLPCVRLLCASVFLRKKEK